MKRHILVMALVMVFVTTGVLYAGGKGILEIESPAYRYSLVNNTGIDRPYGSFGVSAGITWRTEVAEDIFVGPRFTFESTIYDETRRYLGVKFSGDAAWRLATFGTKYPVSLCIDGGLGVFVSHSKETGFEFLPLVRGGFSALFTIPESEEYGIKVKTFFSFDDCLTKGRSIYNFTAGVGFAISLGKPSEKVVKTERITSQEKKPVVIPEGMIGIRIDGVSFEDEGLWLDSYGVMRKPAIVPGTESEPVKKAAEEPFTGKKVYIAVERTLDTEEIEYSEYSVMEIVR